MCIRLITILFVLFSVSASSTVLAKERAKKGSRTPYRGLFPSPLYLTECLLIGPKENAA